MKKIIFSIAIIGLAITLFVLLKGQKPESKRKAKPPVIKTFDIITVKEQSRSIEIKAHGKIQSLTRIQLKSEVQGRLLKSGFKLRAGQNFSPGQLIFQVDSRQAQLALEMTRAKLLTSLSDFIPELRSQSPDAVSKWEEYFKVLQAPETIKASTSKLPKLPTMQESREQMLFHRMGISTLHFTLEQQKLQVDKHITRAPSDGTIVTSQVTSGNIVTPGQILGLFISTSQHEMQVEIPLSSVNQVQVGKNVKIQLEGHDQFISGKMTRISQSVDPSTQNVPAVVSIPYSKNNPKILDSRFGTAIISSKSIQKVFALPVEAMFHGNKVLVMADSTLTARVAKVKIQTKDSVYISTEGFKDGEEVVSELFQEFVTGMKAIARVSQETIQENNQAEAGQ